MRARERAPRARPPPPRGRCPAASPPPSPSPDPRLSPASVALFPPRRRSAAADRLGPELAFLRRLVLDGDWDGADAFVAPLSATRAVDHRAVTAHLRRAAFLELLAGPETRAPDPAEKAAARDDPPDADAIVAALRELRPVLEPRDPRNFDALCALVALPRVADHPEFADWSRSRGRLAAFDAVRRELEPVYPRNERERERERARDGRARALGAALAETYEYERPPAGSAGRSRVAQPPPPARFPGRSEEAAKRPEDDSRRDGHRRSLARANEKKALEETGRSDSGARRWSFAGRVVAEADAGVRCVALAPAGARLPGTTTTKSPDADDSESESESESESDASFVRAIGGAVACATSTRVVRVVSLSPSGGASGDDGIRESATDSSTGKKNRNRERFGRRLVVASTRDAHPPPCSVYALAWGLDPDDDRGGRDTLIATGANDGSVRLARLRYDDASDGLAFFHAPPLESPFRVPLEGRGGHDGAVRAAAFASRRRLVTGGAGDNAPRVWELGEGSQTRGGCSILPAHATRVVAAVADWDKAYGSNGSGIGAARSTLNLAATASADGEVRVWDLRAGAGGGSSSGYVVRAGGGVGGDPGGPAARSSSLASLSLRGDLVAVGFDDGRVAVLDARRAETNASLAAGARTGAADRATLWGAKAHDGECRSVDLGGGFGFGFGSGNNGTNGSSRCALLTAGFDGAVRVWADAAEERSLAWSDDRAHGDKIVAARWGADGAFASCGVDKTVRAWRPEGP